MSTTVLNFSTDINRARLTSLRRRLAAKPQAIADVAKAIGIHRGTMLRYFQHIRAEIHVTRWEKRRANIVAIYALGAGPDAPRPMSEARPVATTTARAKRAAPRPTRAPRTYCYRPQPARRDWSVAMIFGPAGATA
ncbi:hypothetical protein GT347_20215 [Xylophilus rhododendri]|uniref:Uncharacterized protein n=1 Tax=Xylophilus rhododendri TaxID=2697032 RepID=A0A857JAN1_9BURK|nr:hypothetical protein [Xylophilus rhododendri]QHJ00100.1 hypothetical protein GT347_20215 [Xylophilus rhododendri]